MVEISTVANTCTLMHVRKASRVITQLYDEALQPSGLLSNQFTILVTLARVGSATMNTLAQQLVMDRTTLTRNLKPVEKKGLIEIKPGQDKRTRLVSLTALGENTLEQALPRWEQAQSQVIATLGEKQWRAFLAGLSHTAQLGQLE